MTYLDKTALESALELENQRLRAENEYLKNRDDNKFSIMDPPKFEYGHADNVTMIQRFKSGVDRNDPMFGVHFYVIDTKDQSKISYYCSNENICNRGIDIKLAMLERVADNEIKNIIGKFRKRNG